jgi:hypothetical protein
MITAIKNFLLDLLEIMQETRAGMRNSRHE